MRAMLVEVRGVRLKYLQRVPLTVEQQSVGALLPDAADEPFRVAVRPRRPRWNLHDLHRLGGEHGIEGVGELRVPVADQEPERAGPLPSSASRLRACCTVQAAVGCAVTPRMCSRQLVTSMTNNAYSRCSRTVCRQKKSVASSPEACARRNAGQFESSVAAPAPAELRPGSAGWSRCPSRASSPWIRRWPQPGVLPGQPDHQLADLLIDRWATRPARIHPLPPDQPTVPGQQRPRPHNPVRPQLGRQQPDQPGQHRPIHPGQPRPGHLPAQHCNLMP